ncbi:ABC-three component system middle component 6 [Sphaerisporangium sp. NPDC051017]|uniref:ABC-three component system middle component 6 n=1 Tax=Sphaerisporangium sp. NPDC051017 TaxID=3154636 RepID=UPI00343EA861
MLLPDKAIPTDQALLAIGAQILIQLERPGSVSAVWDRLLEWRSMRGMRSALPFWWFSLALDVLYAIGVVDEHNGELVRKSRAV